MNGKGSKPRPLSVKYDDFAANWDNIKGLGKNKPIVKTQVPVQTKKPHDK